MILGSFRFGDFELEASCFGLLGVRGVLIAVGVNQSGSFQAGSSKTGRVL